MVLKAADAARQAVEEGRWLEVEDQRTEAGGREIRILIHP
jgi:hypothetical protein